jgi:hypothetical protein
MTEDDDLFGAAIAPGAFTLAEQIRCVGREISMRKTTYPRWVYAGKMSAPKAEEEIACMEQVLRTLRSLVNDGR